MEKPLKLPPTIMQRVMRFKALKNEEGTLTLFGKPCLIMPIDTILYTMKLMENELGVDKTKWIWYHVGKFQAIAGFKMINERFGYAKTLSEKKKLLDFNTGQTQILGLGAYTYRRMDFENNYFIGEGKSPFADEYKKIFGIQKEPVDYFLNGACAGAVETTIEKEVVSIETKCAAQGKNVCQFVMRPANKWEKSDPWVKKNLILFQEAPTMRELGAKLKQFVV